MFFVRFIAFLYNIFGVLMLLLYIYADRFINCDLFCNFAHVIHIVINAYAKD